MDQSAEHAACHYHHRVRYDRFYAAVFTIRRRSRIYAVAIRLLHISPLAAAYLLMVEVAKRRVMGRLLNERNEPNAAAK